MASLQNSDPFKHLKEDPDHGAYYYTLTNHGSFTPAMLERAHALLGDVHTNGTGFVDAAFTYPTATDEEARAVAIIDHELTPEEVEKLDRTVGAVAIGPLLIH